MPFSTRSRPPLRASSSPAGERVTSTQPVNSPLRFHSLSPCRSRTKVAMAPILWGRASPRPDGSIGPRLTGSIVRASTPRAGLDDPGERPEVGQRLAPLDAPLPLAADRGGEPQLDGALERLVRVGEHAPEQPVDLLRRHRVDRDPADEVHVADLVEGEVHAVHRPVLPEQPPVELGVVLVRLAAEE